MPSRARGGVDADDPEAAEVALAVAPVAVGVACPSAAPAPSRSGSSSACGRSSPSPRSSTLRRFLRAWTSVLTRLICPLAAEQRLDPLRVGGRDLDRARHAALPLRRLLLEDVARVGAPAAELALGGLAEALLGAGMGLHLRHGTAIEADARARAPGALCRSERVKRLGLELRAIGSAPGARVCRERRLRRTPAALRPSMSASSSTSWCARARPCSRSARAATADGVMERLEPVATSGPTS